MDVEKIKTALETLSATVQVLEDAGKGRSNPIILRKTAEALKLAYQDLLALSPATQG
jgi:hypothetical protein